MSKSVEFWHHQYIELWRDICEAAGYSANPEHPNYIKVDDLIKQLKAYAAAKSGSAGDTFKCSKCKKLQPQADRCECGGALYNVTPESGSAGTADAKPIDSLLQSVKAWVETGVHPVMMKIGLPQLNVTVTFRGRRLTIEALPSAPSKEKR